MKRLGRHRTGCLAGAAALGAIVLLSCDGPIVARSPEALYALAKEQIAHARYTPAIDTLSKVIRESPQSETARGARVLHIALLGGMARGFKDVAESYLAGHQQAGAAAYAPQMRAVAMDYFGRSRGRSIEMVEALDRLMREAATGPLRLDFPLPQGLSGGSALLAKVRQGTWVEDEELVQAEREEVRQGLAEMLAGLVDTEGDLNRARERVRFRGPAFEIDPANFYLGAARELVNLSSIYRPEALGDRGMFRLFHERAAAAAERAAHRAAEIGNRRIQAESERLQRHCQTVLQRG